MKVFGSIDTFGIAYALDTNNRGNIVSSSYGNMDIYIKGTNICRYSIGKEKYTFQDALYWPVKWLSENLANFLSYDPFPLPVIGKNAAEVIEIAVSRSYEHHIDLPDDAPIIFDLEHLLWDRSLKSWWMRHGWILERGGTILPELVFLRVENSLIELSWNNRLYFDAIIFESMEGDARFGIDVIKNTILGFLESFINDYSQLQTSDQNGQMASINAWKDALGIFYD